MKIKQRAYLYYGKSYWIFQKNSWYVTIEKVYKLAITNCDIIMTSQPSSLNIAIKNAKQPSIR